MNINHIVEESIRDAREDLEKAIEMHQELFNGGAELTELNEAVVLDVYAASLKYQALLELGTKLGMKDYASTENARFLDNTRKCVMTYMRPSTRLFSQE